MFAAVPGACRAVFFTFPGTLWVPGIAPGDATDVSIPGSCPQIGKGTCSTKAPAEAGGGQVTPCQAVGCTVEVKEWIFGTWVSEIIAPPPNSLSLLFACKHHQSQNFSSDFSLKHLLGCFVYAWYKMEFRKKFMITWIFLYCLASVVRKGQIMGHFLPGYSSEQAAHFH